MIGIRTFFRIAPSIVVTSSAVLVTTTLQVPVAANQKIKLRWWVPFSVGATGGLRAQVIVPAGGTLFRQTLKLFNTVAPLITTQALAASTVFTNAAANAGTHWLEVEAEIENGATAGVIDLQMAQNTSDALSLTILQGGTCDVVTT